MTARSLPRVWANTNYPTSRMSRRFERCYLKIRIDQGLGFALMENLIDDDGKIVTASLGEYKLPNIADVPPLRTLLFEDQDGPGPFQSKPVGEHSAVPTAPCIVNAIYDAIGTQITDLPISAETVYAAIKAKCPGGH